jgi:hypothetical protein
MTSLDKTQSRRNKTQLAIQFQSVGVEILISFPIQPVPNTNPYPDHNGPLLKPGLYFYLIELRSSSEASRATSNNCNCLVRSHLRRLKKTTVK